MAKLKRIIVVAGISIFLGAAVAGFFVCRCDRDNPGLDLAPVVAAGRHPAPPGTVPVSVVTPTPLIKRLKPGYKPSAADTALKGQPAGTSIIHVDPHEGPVDIILPPGGGIFVPQGTTGVVVYEKPPALAALELRPAPFAYAGTDVGLGAALHVARVSRIHVGPAAAWGRGDGPSAGVDVAWNPWRNVDLGAYTGKRILGAGYAVGGRVGLGIK